MQLIIGALFLNSKGLFFLLLLLFPVTVIVPLTTIYALLKLHRSDLSIDVLNLTCLLGLYLSSVVPDWSWTSIDFLVINLGTLSDVVHSKFAIFLVFHFYMVSKQCQVINNLQPFFWWYVDFLPFVFFFYTLCFAYWSNFISYFVSNQISSCFCSSLNCSFGSSFCSIFSCYCCNIHYFFTIFITTKSSWKWQKKKKKKTYPLTHLLYLGSVEYLIFTMST